MDRNVFPEKKYINRAWLFILFMMILTGFGQMPIFKRYYIADIPGLGWLADFYLTHYLHYIGASLLFALFAYCMAWYVLVGRYEFKLTGSAYARIILLSAITVTGIFRVLKNLPDIVFSPTFTLLIDVSHFVFMMAFLGLAAVFLYLKSGWLGSKQ